MSEENLRVWRLPNTPEISGQVGLLGLGSQLKAADPDIVHAHGALSPISLQCLAWRRRLGYTLVLDDHSNVFNLRLSSVQRQLYVKCIACLYKVLDSDIAAYIAVTAASSPILRNQLLIPAEKIREVNLGVDDALFQPSESARRSFREMVGVKETEVLLVTAGKLYGGRDTELLLSAFGLLLRANSNLRLLVVGGGEAAHLQRLKSLAGDLGVTDKVDFMNFMPRKDLNRCYNGADIGVWPGAPSITVLEALGSGLATVLPETPAYRSILANGASVRFHPGDVRTLADAIGSLVRDLELRTAVSEAARSLVEKRLSWTVVAKETLAIYGDLLEKRTGRTEG